MTIVLENANLIAELDGDSGVLLSLRSKPDGYEHLPDHAGANLFRLIAPTDRWDSRHADAPGQRAAATRIEDGVRLVYAGVRAVDDAELPYRVEVDVRLPEDSPELLLSASVTNDDGPPISEVWFPFVGAWTGFGGPGRDTITCPFTIGKEKDPHAKDLATDPMSNWITLWRIRHRWALRSPFGTIAPWLDLSDGDRGLFLINYMRESDVGGFAVENIHGYDGGTGIVLSWFSNPEIEAGSTWRSPVFGLGVHRGDWHVTADRYRTWLRGWWAPPPVPERLRRILAVQNTQFRGFDGEPIRDLAAIPDVARAGLRYGVEDLCVWDYFMLGLYGRTNPADPADYPPDELAQLRDGVAAARDLGVTVSTLVNHRLLAPRSDFARAGGMDAALVNRDGEARREVYANSSHAAETFATWRGPTSVVLCQRSPRFREWATASMERLLDAGFDSLFIDQALEFFPCYSHEHGHRLPGDTHAAAAEWCGSIRDMLRERHPEGYVIGEHADPFNSTTVDVIWNWTWGSGRPDVVAYTLPGILQSWVTDRSVDDAQQGMLHGFHLMLTTRGLEGTLADEPAFGEYVARLVDLRKRTYELTSGATFQDDAGLSVEGAQAKRFSSARAESAVLVNQTDAPVRVRATMAIDGPRGPGTLHALDGTTALGEADTLDVTLAPRDVAVWEVPR